MTTIADDSLMVSEPPQANFIADVVTEDFHVSGQEAEASKIVIAFLLISHFDTLHLSGKVGYNKLKTSRV
jgi:beta-lactamase class D